MMTVGSLVKVSLVFFALSLNTNFKSSVSFSSLLGLPDLGGLMADFK
jgi:hypothetical protein